MTEEVAADFARTKRPIGQALTAGQNRPERLPGLLSVLGHLSKELTDETKTIVNLQPRIRLLDVSAASFSEASSMPDRAVIGAVWAEKWRQRVYFLADETLVALYLEVASGGETPPEVPPLGRVVTKTECNIVEVLYRRLARALTNAFSILVDVTFEVVAVADKLDVEHLCRPAAPVINTRLSVEWLGQIGTIAVVIPLAALEPIRETLASTPVAEPSGDVAEEATDWTRQLSEEIARAFVSMHAILEERPISLNDVRRFAVGQVIEMTTSSMSMVRLDAEERPAFWGQLGKSSGGLLLRVERTYDASDEPAELI